MLQPRRIAAIGTARRLARRGHYLEAGHLYEQLGDWEAAAAAYERGRSCRWVWLQLSALQNLQLGQQLRVHLLGT